MKTLHDLPQEESDDQQGQPAPEASSPEETLEKGPVVIHPCPWLVRV